MTTRKSDFKPHKAEMKDYKCPCGRKFTSTSNKTLLKIVGEHFQSEFHKTWAKNHPSEANKLQETTS